MQKKIQIYTLTLHRKFIVNWQPSSSYLIPSVQTSKLCEDVFQWFAAHVGEHIKATTVGHPHYEALNPKRCWSINHLTHKKGNEISMREKWVRVAQECKQIIGKDFFPNPANHEVKHPLSVMIYAWCSTQKLLVKFVLPRYSYGVGVFRVYMISMKHYSRSWL